jgi:hypothetical protein
MTSFLLIWNLVAWAALLSFLAYQEFLGYRQFKRLTSSIDE